MFWVIVIVLAIFALLIGFGKLAAQDNAKAAYEKSLGELTADPHNAALRMTTLALGRAYANLARNQKGVTVFDEMALMNDINAACGGAAPVHAEATPQRLAKAGPSLQERLKQLEELKRQGLVSEAEYASKRNQLLAEI